MSTPVVFLSHPVRGETPADMARNLVNAELWLEHFVTHTEWAICASWLPYVNILDETVHRERGLRDNLAVLARCDAIVLVGGRMSHGMKLECDHAQALGLAVVDLLDHGFAPPDQPPPYPTLGPRSPAA